MLLTLSHIFKPESQLQTTNDEQIEYWNGPAGQSWVAAQVQLDRMLAPVSTALLDMSAPRQGQRAVDVGCGCGDTALALARQGAAVWGIDISEPMLALARSRSGDVPNVAFSRVDAATASFTPDHELMISRFGVMFFADPFAAFSNLRTALTSEGRLCFVCWQSPRLNPWVAIAGKAVQPFLPEPDVQPDPRAPGPFAFADADYLQDILTRAGFADVAIEPFTPTLHLADDLDGAMAFLQQVGPLSRALAELDGDDQTAALHAAREAMAAHTTDKGLDLGAACWLVSARRG